MIAIHRSDTLGLERVTVTVRPHVTDMALREPDAGYQSSTHALQCAAKAVRRAVVFHVWRDKLSSITYSEELIFSMSASLQSTDRHHGIVGQEYCHFQRDS
jgi:hypothetical protein